MRKRYLLLSLAAGIIVQPAGAQQTLEPHDRFDTAIMTGAASTNNPASIVWCVTNTVGWFVTGSSKASLWVEFLPIGGNTDFNVSSLGLRGMFKVSHPVSVYAAAGGGVADYNIGPNHIWHGLFDYAGGLDIRLTRRWSIRGELRDYVSGLGLGGSNGRHNLTPVVGVALRY